MTRHLGPSIGATLALALLPLVPSALTAQAPQALSELRPALDERIARHQGTVGLVVLDPRTGEELAIRGDQPFPTASVIKVPVLVEVFHQIEQGRLGLEDPLLVLAADQRPGSGVLRFLSTPHQLTVKDAAFLMIALSDNTATNLLLDKVGLRSVNARMDTLGFPGTAIFAEVFGRDATTIAPDSSAAFGLGVTTPLDMARILGMIYRGEAVSGEASSEMVAMLRQQFYGGERIPRHLPGGTAVAHKDGSVNASRSDCGIVYSEPRDYVLCVFTDENEDRSWRLDNDAHVLIADVARMVHEHLVGEVEG